MNNPRRIQFANGNVTEYISSAGTKLCATSRTLSAGVLSPMTGVMQQSSAVSPRDGEIHFTYYCGNVIYDGITPVYHYYLKDHLGNNRVVLGQNGAVEQVNHYYPFGGLMGESTGGSTQPYKYNGKELDRTNGLDWCDYGARWYDATRTGWTSMDPLCEKYYDISPYVYCEDNPIKNIDTDGKKPRMYVETNGLGHVFVTTGSGKNTTVYTYGRYAALGKDKSAARSTTPIGEGILVVLKGQMAKKFIENELKKEKASVFEFTNACDDKVDKYFKDKFQNSEKIPNVGKYKNNPNARVIDTYNLFTNNCTTTSINAISAGNGDVTSIINDVAPAQVLMDLTKNVFCNGIKSFLGITNKIIDLDKDKILKE